MARNRNRGVLATMNAFIRSLLRFANRHTPGLLVTGLVGVVFYNSWLWRRDRALADRLCAQRRCVPQLARTPKISALVAAWNEHDQIDAHIQSLLALSYPNIELIICAGGTDDTLESARRYACDRVIVLEQRKGEGKQRAIARCEQYASGEIIYLTDADCRYVDEALVQLVAPLVNEGEQSSTGSSQPLDEQIDQMLPRYLWSSDVMSDARSPMYREGLLGRNAAITRAALKRIGGLDFDARTGTDYQLARRLIQHGVAIRFVGDSSVPSRYPDTLATYRQKQSRWLRNLMLHGRRYRAWHDVAVTMQTIGTGGVMLLAPLTAIVFGRSVIALWSLLVFHATSSKLRYMLFTARLHQRAVLWNMPITLVPLTIVDFAVWALTLFDLLDPKRREQW
jgi:glycosyltransferase involved in cell wall biosynthesis